ncbi:probable trehalose-phosphate phosphatase H isoform X1 [Arachis ipaensis]|uniref:Trehalose 6-phosphate phosphatase n=2 Tax=Arachis TaxID=3817 RepID=A0A445CE97_ARAHY|nr:probable trehalose-phosphate phosphatase H isoform X1 [Arachis ipaensis]QHN92753.1 putative trehalose-phosphate phosphatase J [Arachis hypogaea]RYR49267.1 hypothetical protein Ahy_A07g035647 [Arachis hypogaea]
MKSSSQVSTNIVKLTESFSHSTVSAASSQVQKSSMALFGGLLGQYQKRRLLFTVEESNNNKGGSNKVNPWLESMRASSPTRITPNNNPSWIVGHPSALKMFDEMIWNSKGKQVVVFLDYDGTLSPIVADPEKAFMTKKMRAILKDIARLFPTAIVTGRCIDKVYDFVRLGEVYYAGSHGMDIKGPTKSRNHQKGNNNEALVLFQPASQFLPMINEVYKILVEKMKAIPGAKVENNKFCLSVHFRCVEEKCWSALAEQVNSVLKEYPKLKLTHGRKVIEIRPTIKWDKGKAIEFLLESLGYANSTSVFPIYIGDDTTDEDAFKVLRSKGQGIGILVSQIQKETNAIYTLHDPLEVGQFLRRLADWKKNKF